MPARLLYVMDPMCSWCWGFAPVAEALVGCGFVTVLVLGRNVSNSLVAQPG